MNTNPGFAESGITVFPGPNDCIRFDFHGQGAMLFVRRQPASVPEVSNPSPSSPSQSSTLRAEQDARTMAGYELERFRIVHLLDNLQDLYRQEQYHVLHADHNPERHIAAAAECKRNVEGVLARLLKDTAHGPGPVHNDRGFYRLSSCIYDGSRTFELIPSYLGDAVLREARRYSETRSLSSSSLSPVSPSPSLPPPAPPLPLPVPQSAVELSSRLPRFLTERLHIDITALTLHRVTGTVMVPAIQQRRRRRENNNEEYTLYEQEVIPDGSENGANMNFIYRTCVCMRDIGPLAVDDEGTAGLASDLGVLQYVKKRRHRLSASRLADFCVPFLEGYVQHLERHRWRWQQQRYRRPPPEQLEREREHRQQQRLLRQQILQMRQQAQGITGQVNVDDDDDEDESSSEEMTAPEKFVVGFVVEHMGPTRDMATLAYGSDRLGTDNDGASSRISGIPTPRTTSRPTSWAKPSLATLQRWTRAVWKTLRQLHRLGTAWGGTVRETRPFGSGYRGLYLCASIDVDMSGRPWLFRRFCHGSSSPPERRGSRVIETGEQERQRIRQDRELRRFLVESDRLAAREMFSLFEMEWVADSSESEGESGDDGESEGYRSGET